MRKRASTAAASCGGGESPAPVSSVTYSNDSLPPRANITMTTVKTVSAPATVIKTHSRSFSNASSSSQEDELYKRDDGTVIRRRVGGGGGSQHLHQHQLISRFIRQNRIQSLPSSPSSGASSNQTQSFSSASFSGRGKSASIDSPRRRRSEENARESSRGQTRTLKHHEEELEERNAPHRFEDDEGEENKNVCLHEEWGTLSPYCSPARGRSRNGSGASCRSPLRKKLSELYLPSPCSSVNASPCVSPSSSIARGTGDSASPCVSPSPPGLCRPSLAHLKLRRGHSACSNGSFMNYVLSPTSSARSSSTSSPSSPIFASSPVSTNQQPEDISFTPLTNSYISCAADSTYSCSRNSSEESQDGDLKKGSDGSQHEDLKTSKEGRPEEEEGNEGEDGEKALTSAYLISIKKGNVTWYEIRVTHGATSDVIVRRYSEFREFYDRLLDLTVLDKDKGLCDVCVRYVHEVTAAFPRRRMFSSQSPRSLQERSLDFTGFLDKTNRFLSGHAQRCSQGFSQQIQRLYDEFLGVKATEDPSPSASSIYSSSSSFVQTRAHQNSFSSVCSVATNASNISAAPSSINSSLRARVLSSSHAFKYSPDSPSSSSPLHKQVALSLARKLSLSRTGSFTSLLSASPMSTPGNSRPASPKKSTCCFTTTKTTTTTTKAVFTSY